MKRVSGRSMCEGASEWLFCKAEGRGERGEVERRVLSFQVQSLSPRCLLEPRRAEAPPLTLDEVAKD